MRRVRASIKVGRQKKIKIKKHPRGRGCHKEPKGQADRASRTGKPSPREAGTLPIFPEGKVFAGNPGRILGRAVEHPGSRVTNRGSAPRGERTTNHWPRSLMGWSSRLVGPQEQLRQRLGRRLRAEGAAQSREHDFSGPGPGAQGARGHSPGSGAPLGTGGVREDTGQRGRSCCQAAPGWADQRQAPRASRPVRTGRLR